MKRLARALGFTAVIAGLYWYDESQLACERAAALAERAWVEGFVLGNQGLLSGRYSLDRLATEIERLEAESGRPVTTCEPGGRYLDDRRLLGLGDWIFPNVHPWYASRRAVDEGIAFVEAQYLAIPEAAQGRTVVLKEVWWPSAGDPAATPDGQAEFFRRLRRTDLPLVFGAAYDASWNTSEEPVGQHWGLHADDGAPKPALGALQTRVALEPAGASR
jgi:exo-beta-1,3-glucanase (GH17 family)